MVRRRVLIAAALTLVAGCAAEPASEPKKVSAKLDFTAKTVDDQQFAGSALAGKAAVLWFWTPWCPRCMGEAPHLGALAKEHAGKITFVGVGAQDGLPAMRKFVAENEVSGFSHLADEKAEVWARFGITQQPSYAFVYADGSIELVKQQLTEGELKNRVAKLTAP